MSNNSQQDFAMAFYWGDRKTGSLALITRRAGKTAVQCLPSEAESSLSAALKPILVGLTPDAQAVLLDPKTKSIRYSTTFPCDTFAAHVYSDQHSDPQHPRDWYMNDGEKPHGNDTINCGDNGSSVTAVEKANTTRAKYVGTVCVGRGHHQAAFTAPSVQAPNVPHRTYISNLNDGTVSIIGNDAADKATYMKLLGSINLCEADKEDGKADAIPNNAFPHGLAYSPLTGKVYNLNNGYGTLLTIDPLTMKIEARMAIKGFSNAFMVPGGRYLIGRGADRKSDPQHAIGKMAVLDVTTMQIVAKLDLPDIYLSKYYFNLDASKLYFTTGVSGSPEQQVNLKSDVLLSFDLSQLPKLSAPKEIKVGTVGTMDFAGTAKSQLAFASDGAAGELVVIDGAKDEIVERIKVGPGASHSRVWAV